MMHLILFKTDPNSQPRDIKERKKIWEATIEMMKKEIDSGAIKMLGLSPGGTDGFMVSTQSPKEILSKRMAGMVPSEFKVLPMLSLEEIEDIVNEL